MLAAALAAADLPGLAAFCGLARELRLELGGWECARRLLLVAPRCAMRSSSSSEASSTSDAQQLELAGMPRALPLLSPRAELGRVSS